LHGDFPLEAPVNTAQEALGVGEDFVVASFVLRGTASRRRRRRRRRISSAATTTSITIQRSRSADGMSNETSMGVEEEAAASGEEASGNSHALSACGWYHGPITRIAAELSVEIDGDFLVRDCISSPGDFVLTCRWAGQVMHFRLNTAEEEEEENKLVRKKYHLEGETFDSVAELVAVHVNQRRPLSLVSGALIARPVLREVDQHGGQGSATAADDDDNRKGGVMAALGAVDLPSRPPEPPLPASMSSFKPQLAPTDCSTASREIRGAWSKDETALTASVEAAVEEPQPSPGVKTTFSRLFWFAGDKAKKSATASSSLTLPRKPKAAKTSQLRFNSLPRPKTKGIFGGGRGDQGKNVGRASSSSTREEEEGKERLWRLPSDSALLGANGGGGDGEVNPQSQVPPSADERKRRPLPPPPSATSTSAALKAAKGSVGARSRRRPEPFPQDIVLPAAADQPPPPPPPPPPPVVVSAVLSNGSSVPSTMSLGQRPSALAAYDVPVTSSTSILSEAQVSGSKLYDRPRPLSKFRPPPPPPPSRKSSSGSSGGGQAPSHLSVANGDAKSTQAPSRLSYEDQHGVSASEDQSNTDTSFLEHRELTPLLSEDDSLEGVDDASSLPGDPFPAGLPAKPPLAPPKMCGSVTVATTTTSTSSATSSSNSSLLDSSPPTESNMTAIAAKEITVAVEAIAEEPPLPSSTLLDPMKWRPRHFFDGREHNKPLEPAAIAGLRGLLGDYAGRPAAQHMLALDVQLLSLNKVGPDQDLLCGLPALALVGGRRLREDVMERWLCTRLIVLVTVFAAPTVDEASSALAAWTSTARSLDELGDFLALSSVVTALNDERLRALNDLWRHFHLKYPQEAEALEDNLMPAVADFHGLRDQKDDDDSNDDHIRQKEVTTVPDLVPFLCGCRDLHERKDFRKVFAEIYGQAAAAAGAPEECPAFQAHLQRVHASLGRQDSLRRAAAAVLDTAVTSPALSEALDTRTHLRLLWGSRGCLATAEERHVKFGRAVTALASLCQEAERQRLKTSG
jgi:hypothetical protein